jgi:hypothetical protein
MSYFETAKELWDDIKERFDVVNGPRVQQLKSELAQCKQGGLSMVSYYGKLKSLWDDLANYEQALTCTCKGCTCGIQTKLEKRREEERCHVFLMGLDDGMYGTVRSNLLATDPMPSLNKMYSILVQEERMRSITRGKEERTEVMALAVQASAKMKAQEIKNDSPCTHCNRPGHDESGCFQLIGYPEWWGERPRNNGKAGGRGQNRTRGTASNNGRAQRGPARAHAVQNLGSSGGDIENSVMTGLSKEQWQTLVEMLNTSKVTSNESMTGKTKLNVWILDSGASNHMTGCLQHLSDVREVVGCPVGLPNGQTAMSTKEGTMRLADGLILKNVLYVPKLNCNLISISQLSDESNCTVQFTANLCAIQDHTSKMLIGAGERRDGLYFFREVPKAKAYKVEEIKQLEVWHQRLGHPSWKTTQLVSNCSGSRVSDLKNKVCDTCQRAKQTRETFPLSSKHASDVFDLIHCDLWGAYRTPSSCGASYFLTIVDDCSRAVWIFFIN